jgi:hypothetical protein
MIVEKQMECRLAGETEGLGENLPQRHFCPSQNPTWPDPGLNLGRRGGKPATNRLSYGAANSYVGNSTYFRGYVKQIISFSASIDIKFLRRLMFQGASLSCLIGNT